MNVCQQQNGRSQSRRISQDKLKSDLKWKLKQRKILMDAIQFSSKWKV